MALYDVQSVSRQFGESRRLIRAGHGTLALDGVDLQIHEGQSLGLVGESGSGKTTLARLLVGFDTPTAGTVRFRGDDIAAMRRKERRRFTRDVQMVFQNPYAALNPFRTIRDSLVAGYRAGGTVARRDEDASLAELLGLMGLHPSMLDRYPHEFSGGQRQRIVLVRALTVNPSVLVADEPVSALDVSIQAQILNLLNDLKDDPDLGLTVIMVSHDLGVANFFCDRIAVMYAGRIVEYGSTDQVVNRSHHPYTRMLLSAAPNPNPRVDTPRPWVRSELAVVDPPREGCVFAPRCWLRTQLDNPEECMTTRPPMHDSGGQLSACHFVGEVATGAQTAMAATGAFAVDRLTPAEPAGDQPHLEENP